MISNLANQLKEQGALHRMDEVLAEIPKVRKDLGYPPLVTPTSQIVGTQAFFNVLAGERYKTITTEVKYYLQGRYGKAPAPVCEHLRFGPSAARRSSSAARPTCWRRNWTSCARTSASWPRARKTC